MIKVDKARIENHPEFTHSSCAFCLTALPDDFIVLVI
jgi:hypothetical protein